MNKKIITKIEQTEKEAAKKIETARKEARGKVKKFRNFLNSRWDEVEEELKKEKKSVEKKSFQSAGKEIEKVREETKQKINNLQTIEDKCEEYGRSVIEKILNQ